jgi:FAD:protein FMN transferase
METVAVARHAMATRFEIVLQGDDRLALRASGEEALAEIASLEAQLSLYQPTSEISHLNARAAAGPVRVEPTLFGLLQRARQLHRESAGAFDITVAPLMRCWGFMRGTGRFPAAGDLAEARSKVGMRFVELNAEDFTVRFLREGVMLDLGAIGKGYAVECAAELLQELGITSALLHGGTSTVHAIGTQADGQPWKIAIPSPEAGMAEIGFRAQPESGAPPDGERPLAVVSLRDESLSLSAVWGKAFEADGRIYGHVIDPRSGSPVAGAMMAAVVLPSATDTDALSTALLTLGRDGLDSLAGQRSGWRALVVTSPVGTNAFEVATRGIPLLEAATPPPAPPGGP